MSEWIPVSEALPNNRKPKEYLVVRYRYCDEDSRAAYGHGLAVMIASKNPDRNYFLGDSEQNPAQFWMPLPPPPETQE